jgi:hypothetical protein
MDTKTDTKPSFRICPSDHEFGVRRGVHSSSKNGFSHTIPQGVSISFGPLAKSSSLAALPAERLLKSLTRMAILRKGLETPPQRTSLTLAEALDASNVPTSNWVLKRFRDGV